MRRALLLPSLVVMLATAGCGRDGDRAQVRTTAERFYTAVGQKDGAMACAQLSSAAAQEVAKNAGSACEKAVTDVQVEGKAVQSVRVYGDSATVSFAGGDTAFLSLTKQGWRVHAAGCKREAPSGPEDCEVQA